MKKTKNKKKQQQKTEYDSIKCNPNLNKFEI